MPEVIKLVKFGRGDTVFGISKDGHSFTCSGYGTPERPHAASGKNIPDGTPVIDIRQAVETPEGVSHVLRGPMVDVKLRDGEIDQCPKPSKTMVDGLSDGFLALAGLQAIHKGPEPGPLDSVSVADYVRGWAKVGARVGEYQNGQIVWRN